MNDKVGVKFCGGCNPLINRSRIFKELDKRLPGGCRTIRSEDREPCEIGVMLCGCQVACVDRDEYQDLARHWIKVAGLMIDMVAVNEEDIVETVLAKYQALKEENRSGV